MTLYFLIFGQLVGSKIGSMNGVSYMEYIAPGLIMMTVITNSYANVAGSFFSSKFQKYIEEMMVSPMPSGMILAGFLMGGTLRGILCGAIVSFISSIFVPLHFNHPWVAFISLFVSAWLFSAAGFLNALYAKKFDDINIVPTFFLTPLTYLGGVFYSISLLPDFWRSLSHFNPIVYMVSLFRYGYTGLAEVDNTIALSVSLGMALLLTGICYKLLSRGYGLKS
jgi:ABC-2 type transport system permease protein